MKSSVKDAQENGTEVNLHEIGVEVVMNAVQTILERYEVCEKEIFVFLSCLSGMSASEIETLGFSQYASMLIDVSKDSEFSDFF